MSQLNRKSGVSAIGFIALSLLFVGIISIYIFRQTVFDYFVVLQFKPSSEILSIVERDKMSELGKFTFYANQPEVDSASVFNQTCSKTEKTTSILGCLSNSRIYIFDITDTRLDGIREVTAAHEMLHAAYQRMSETEKTKVNELLETEYSKIQDNKQFSDLLDFYARTEPGERDNELHSIIGTSVASLDPDLEAHYEKYFTDRQAVVSLYSKYNSVFSEFADKAKVLSDKLLTLANQISTNSAKYNSEVMLLNSDITVFNQKADNNQFASRSQFNLERSSLTSRSETLAALKSQIDSDIVSYNASLEEYNSIATQSTQLYNSINSTLVSAPSV